MASPVSVATWFGQNSAQVQEVLSKQITDFQPTFDPRWQAMLSSSGVIPTDQLGRDLKIIKLFRSPFAGEVDPMGPSGDFGIYGDSLVAQRGTRFELQGRGFGTAAQVFPDGLDGVKPRVWRLGIPMRGMKAGLALTLAEMMADATPAVIGDVISPIISGFARHIAYKHIAYWYLNQNEGYKLANTGSGGVAAGTSTGATSFTFTTDTTGSNSADTLVFQPTNYACERFQRGVLVQFYDNSLTNLRTFNGGAESRFIVTDVDGTTNTVRCMTFDGSGGLSVSTTQTAATTDKVFNSGDACVFANSKGSNTTPFSGGSRFSGLAGINSWLKFGDSSGMTATNANTLLGDERDQDNQINVNDISELKSLKIDQKGDVLTEQRMRAILRRWHAAKGIYGFTLTDLIASDGVWMGMEETLTESERRDRTHRLSSMNNIGSDNADMYDGPKLTYDGKTYNCSTSPQVESGTVYGINNRWDRIVPPQSGSTQRFSQLKPGIPFEFVASALTGLSTNQMPVFRVIDGRNRVTEYTSMPGMSRMQLVPRQPVGLKIINVAESRVYGS